MRFSKALVLSLCASLGIACSAASEPDPTPGQGTDELSRGGQTGGGGGGTGGDGTAIDPCAGKKIPACVACPAGGFQNFGQACATVGERCDITPFGDALICEPDHRWLGVIHPPLGLGCNKTCEPSVLPPPPPPPPICPPAGTALRTCVPCPAGLGTANAGQACNQVGYSCDLSKVGDELSCTSNGWQVAIHPPLGTSCNQVCR